MYLLIKKLIPIAALSSLLLFLGISRVQATPLGGNEVFDGLNFENLFIYTPLQHDIVSHVLTLGYAAQLAGLVYFLATLSNIARKRSEALEFDAALATSRR